MKDVCESQFVNADSRTLDQLIFDLVEQRDDRDVEELYDRLMSARWHLALGQPKPGAPLAVQSAQIEGRQVWVFYVSAEDPRLGPHIGTVQGPEALRMVLKTTAEGVVLQSSQEPWLIFDRPSIVHVLKTRITWVAGSEPLAALMRREPGAVDDGRVPEGHKVVTFKPTNSAYLQQTTSGIWLLGFGDGSEPHTALDMLEGLEHSSIAPYAIWLLRADFVDSLKRPEQFFARASSIVSLKAGLMTHHAVLSGRSTRHEWLVDVLHALAIGVNFCADDGTSFVEVHRPDRIVIGIPGPRVPYGE